MGPRISGDDRIVRHCEAPLRRSNPVLAHGSGLLRSARNDGAHLLVLATRFARALLAVLPPSETEGAGKTGCTLHPQVSHARIRSVRAYKTTGPGGATGLPCAVVSTGLLRALPGERARLATVACALVIAHLRGSTPLGDARTTRLRRPLIAIGSDLLMASYRPVRGCRQRSFHISHRARFPSVPIRPALA